MNEEINDKNFIRIGYEDEEQKLYFVGFDQLEKLKSVLKLKDTLIDECKEGISGRFEKHEDYFFVLLNVPKLKGEEYSTKQICIYFDDKSLAFISSNPSEIVKMIFPEESKKRVDIRFEKIIRLFFESLTKDDSALLQGVERGISEMEETLMEEDPLINSDNINFIKEIIGFRKKLLMLKRHYKQLIDILEDIEENEGALIFGETKGFHTLLGRLDRLYREVDNLQDYLSQVREAYQAQVDIGQNSIMRLFTVITAIFLPLTLLVGWYGMNLQMPEFHSSLSYPIVIGVSIIIAGGGMFYFKKNKWF